MTHILAPIAEPYSPDVVEAFKSYPQRDGYIIGLFRVFANSLRHLRKGFVNLLDRDSPLSMRERACLRSTFGSSRVGVRFA